MRKKLLLFAAFAAFASISSYGQIVGGNIFLQGKFTEIGLIPNASFGAATSPGTYHPNVGGGNALAEVYDGGHDGWAVGTPYPETGDFTYPGTPQEGWSVGVNGTYIQAFQAGGYAGGASFGGVTNVYSNAGGRITDTWTGTTTGAIAGLKIVQETRIDTLASWVVVTAKMYNTTGAVMNNVYYERTCDPDNDEVYSGNFATNNTVTYQNDVDHRVQVSTTGTTSADAYMAIGTKDCRAKAYVVCTSCGLFPVNNLAQIYGGTGGASGYTYSAGTTVTGDIGVGVVWNIGTIAAGDSTVVSYAYIFGDNTLASTIAAGGANTLATQQVSIDSAFPEPLLVLNGVTANPSGAAPAPTYDTFNACGTGLTTLPVNLLNSNDKDWTWATWTWSPGTGLATTSGVTNTINVTALPPMITYTITGTNTALCATRVMYLTIKTCNGATVNSPCIGDPLDFNAPGDSTGATYIWYGPAPSTTTIATTQSFTISPSVWADTGTYHVIKTVAGTSDTSFCTVVIHPKPVLNVTSSIPLCGTPSTTLNLGVTPDSVGETFSWTGPAGFTSTLQFPTITPFDSSKEGVYTVDATTQYGCTNAANISVYEGIVGDFTYTIKRGCPYDIVSFVDTAYNASGYSWNFQDGSVPVTTRSAVHSYMNAAAPGGIYTVTVSYSNAHCTSSATHVVDIRHTVTAAFTPTSDTLCLNPLQSAIFYDGSSATVDLTVGVSSPGQIDHRSWDFGDGSTIDTTSVNPTHTYVNAGKYFVVEKVTDSVGCVDTESHWAYVVRVDINSFHDTTLCLRQPMLMVNTVTEYPDLANNVFTYSWWESSPNLSDDNIQNPYLSGFGTFTDILTATTNAPYGCFAMDTMHIHSVLGQLLTNVTPDQIIPYGASIQLNSDNELYYHWVPNDGSLNNANINNPNATPLQTTTYTVYGMDQYGCVDSAFVTISVDSTMTEGIPSAFTPNGDGKNDVFRPVGLKYQRLVEFRVFNRWGQQVFYSNNINDAWDGTFNGVPQDIGVYNYVVIISRPGSDNHEGENIVYKGNVTLLR